MPVRHDHAPKAVPVVPWPVPWLAAIAAGVLLVLAQPPVAARPLAFLVPALLAFAAESAPGIGRRPATLGVVGGLVGNMWLVHWVSLRAGLLAWVLLGLVGAAWWALSAELLAWALRRRWSTVIAPLLWVGVDAWRGSWPLSGFGWGTLGVAQAGSDWLAPLARVLGEKGLTLAVVAMSLSAWVAVRDGWIAHVATRREDPTPSPDAPIATTPALEAARFGLAGLVATVLVVTLVTVEPPPETGTLDVLAVQGNDLEFPTGPYLQDARTVARQALEATEASVAADGPPALVVWPEGTVGMDPARDAELAGIVDRAGAVTEGRLVLGTDFENPDGDGLFRVSTRVATDGTLGPTYVKRQLVPFGEYVPFRSLLSWYPPLEQVPRDVIPGTEPASLDVDGTSVAVAICFESMYPEVVRSNLLAGDRPSELVVVSTSDSSYGRSGQPAQHVDQSRMRALETGRWVVHATTSGITTLVDPSGTLHGGTDLFTVDTVRGEVGLVTGLTPFLRIGDVLAPTTRLLVVLVLLSLLIHRLRTRR